MRLSLQGKLLYYWGRFSSCHGNPVSSLAIHIHHDPPRGSRKSQWAPERSTEDGWPKVQDNISYIPTNMKLLVGISKLSSRSLLLYLQIGGETLINIATTFTVPHHSKYKWKTLCLSTHMGETKNTSVYK